MFAPLRNGKVQVRVDIAPLRLVPNWAVYFFLLVFRVKSQELGWKSCDPLKSTRIRLYFACMEPLCVRSKSGMLGESMST